MIAVLRANIGTALLGTIGWSGVVGGIIALEILLRAPACLTVVTVTGLLIGVVMAFMRLSSVGPLVADLLRGTRVRVTGPICVHMEEHVSDEDGARSYSYSFTADGRTFPLSSDTYERVCGVTWGTLEYARWSRTVFMLRDATGRLVL
jgi:hypothetical protein